MPQDKSKKEEEMDSKGKALLIAGLAADKKASDVVLLEMEGLTSFTEYFVICSGTSTTQVKTIADYIVESLKARGIRPMGVEGASNAKWILIDFADVVVHIFDEETRAFYELEKLWLDAPRLEAPVGPGKDEHPADSEAWDEG